MIIKRVQKSGQANFFYLPQKWISDFSIKPGDYLNIDINPQGQLIASPVNVKQVNEKIQLSIDECDFTFLNRIIYGCFVSGFDSFSISIRKPLNRDEFLAHKREIDVRIEGVDLVDISLNSIELGFSAEIQPIIPLFKNFLSKADNYLNAVKFKDYELSKHYGIELDRTLFLLLRNVNKSLRSVSSDLSKSDASIVSQLVNYIYDVIYEDEVSAKSVNDIELIIKTIRLVKSDFEKLSLDTVQKLADILSSFKSGTVKFFVKCINRLLINYYLNKIVINA